MAEISIYVKISNEGVTADTRGVLKVNVRSLSKILMCSGIVGG